MTPNEVRDAAEERFERQIRFVLEIDRLKTVVRRTYLLHADRAETRITNLSQVDARAAADIASNMETALRAHEKVLSRLATNDVQSKAEVGPLQSEVDSELGDTVKVRMDAEEKVRQEGSGPDVKSAAEGKINAANNVIKEVSSYIDARKAQLGADAVTKAQAQLTSAQSLVVQANTKLTAGAYADAFNLGNQAIRTAQEAKLLIEAQGQLEVDLHLDGRASKSSETSHFVPEVKGLNDSEQNDGGDGHDGLNIDAGF